MRHLELRCQPGMGRLHALVKAMLGDLMIKNSNISIEELTLVSNPVGKVVIER